MKITEPKVEIIDQEFSIKGINKMVERAARICYKSEHLIKEGSAENLISRLKEWKHYTPFEHGTVCLKLPLTSSEVISTVKDIFKYYSTVNYGANYAYVTTNMRYILEHKLEGYLKYLSNPTEKHEKRITVIFTCSRAIAQEFTRHRLFSFNMESQRYCNYTLNKFSNEVAFIKPIWVETKVGASDVSIEWSDAMMKAEEHYFSLLDKGLKPEEAREVLPNSCKTELMMTGTIDQWKDFINQRCSNKAHPEARLLANEVKNRFLVRGLIY